jgi:hypothetical protein
MGLTFAGHGGQLRGGINLKVGEAQGGLVWYSGESYPAQLRGCLADGLGLLLNQRAQQGLLGG